MTASLSSIDSERFGFPIARAEATDAEGVEQALGWCGQAGVRMLVLRVDCAAVDALLAAQRRGAILLDTVVTWACTPAAPARVSDGVRHATAADAAGVERLARLAFAGYPNHYRNDPRLAPALVDEIHPSWAARCCERAGERDTLLVAREGDADVGFAAVQFGEGASADIALFAVAPQARGRGTGRRLLADAVAVAAGRGARSVTYTTHLDNLAAQRMLCAGGLAPVAARHTFHLWFDA